MGVAHGHAYNSGASFLQATGIPTATFNSKIAFNDVCYGFVPHGGSTYYLTRLPGELGTFMAITGLPITGVDARVLGLADMHINISKPFEKEIRQTMMAKEFPIPHYYLLNDNGAIDPWSETISNRKKHLSNQNFKDMGEALKKRHENLIADEFFEPRDKKPQTTGLADYKYKKMIKQYNDSHFKVDEPAYLGYD